MMQRLNIDYIRENLRTLSLGQSLYYFEKVSSTNDKLAELARGGAAEGTAILAETQTSGRGRSGNAWYSPPGFGIYLSVLFRPELPAIRLSGITLAWGLSCARAIGQCTPATVMIKWPNDLYLHGRKIGGLLTEHFAEEEGQFLVLGIGLNVNNELIPLELCDTASSIYLETGCGLYREDLILKILENLEADYRRFVASGLDELREELEPRFYLTKRWVSVEIAKGESVRGVATGFDLQGALLVIDGQGQTVRCQSGTVTEIEA